MIFQPIQKTLTAFAGLADTISEWESKGLSDGKMKPAFTVNNSLSPKLVWMNNSTIRTEFKGSCLKQGKVTSTPNKIHGHKI